MIRSLYSAASGMEAQQTNIDVIANNLANVNTPGFKGGQAQFEDLLYDTEKQPGTLLGTGGNTPGSLQVGYGTKLVAVTHDFTQGDFITETGQPLDLGIQGKGFFKVQLADGSGGYAYTRAGAFQVNQNGEIVNNDGLQLVGAPTIPADATNVAVGQDGTITLEINGQTQNAGKVGLSSFINPEGLKALGGNLFTETQASGTAQDGIAQQNGLGSINQGYLENSNVQVVSQMVNMIQAQRAYEVNSKAIQATDEMLQTANGLRR